MYFSGVLILFGFLLANRMKIPFIPIRKAGKLPGDTLSIKYDLEYGSAEIEIHQHDVEENWNIVIHDDLLATGGTACAAADLLLQLKTNILGKYNADLVQTLYALSDLYLLKEDFISSELYLKKALDIMTKEHYKILNIDINIILETPNLNSYINLMRKNLSKLININVKNISIKATTADRLGFIGAQKGIMSTSTVLLIKI